MTQYDMLIESGALTMALNVLRRAGKNEVADELESSATRRSENVEKDAARYRHLRSFIFAFNPTGSSTWGFGISGDALPRPAFNPTFGNVHCNFDRALDVVIQERAKRESPVTTVTLPEPISDILSDLKESWKRTTPGSWGKGETTHKTVSRNEFKEEYHVAEFRHADDAQFCDLAHAFMPPVLQYITARDGSGAIPSKLY